MRRSGLLRAILILAAALSATNPSSGGSDDSPGTRTFWAGIDYLGLIFKAVGSLGGGADRGQIWVFDLATDARRQVSNAGDLSWPVLAPDRSTIFALNGRQVVRVALSGGGIAPFGPEADWRKLVGVDGAGDVLGFVAGRPRAQPALIAKNGEIALLPQPTTEREQERVSVLLQENLAYANGRKLLVRRSERGGRGFDVSMADGDVVKNISDCGDDACGQPSLSQDGRYVVYIRSPAR